MGLFFRFEWIMRFDMVRRGVAAVLMLMFVLTPAWALSCMSPHSMRENAHSVYLVRLVAMDETGYSSRNSIEQFAQVEVLRVYRGDATALAELKKISLMVACNETWGPPCSILNPEFFPFRERQLWVMFDSDAYEERMWVGECSGAELAITSGQELQAFEAENPPIWIRESQMDLFKKVYVKAK